MSPASLVLTAAEPARNVVLQMMAPTDAADDALFRPERSLGSFAAKISLASRLALLDPAVAKALHALRGVRIDVAHSTDATSLAAPHLRKL